MVGFGLDFERPEGREVLIEARRDGSWSIEARSLLVKNLLRSSARVVADAPWSDVQFTMVTFAVLEFS